MFPNHTLSLISLHLLAPLIQHPKNPLPMCTLQLLDLEASLGYTFLFSQAQRFLSGLFCYLTLVTDVVAKREGAGTARRRGKCLL